MATCKVAVIGSLNIDFITRTSRMPEAGETLTASSFDTGFGGKGANQAVACARLADKNVKVQMVGNVGHDTFGLDYFVALRREGIDTTKVRMLDGEHTGLANIIVEESSGENRILLAPNANHNFSPTPDETWDLVPEDADVVVFQLEIPLPMVLYNIRKASLSGKHVVLNPAPAVMLPDEIYRHIDTLVLNEGETLICGANKHDSHIDQASSFLRKGVKGIVIITLGENGLAWSAGKKTSGTMPAEDVAVVDTTAAGDTFVSAYVAKLAKDLRELEAFDHPEALKFATYAASKAVGKEGAMDSIPYLHEM